MIKLLPILLAALVLVGAKSTNRVQLDYGDSYDDAQEQYSNVNNFQQTFSNAPGFNQFVNGGNFHQQSYSSGPGVSQVFNNGGGHSSFYSNGNVIFRRSGGPNNAEETLIQVADPHIEITNGKGIISK